MKSIRWICLASAALLICTSAMASEQSKTKADAKKNKANTKQKVTPGATEQGTLTGSYIKQTVRRHGLVTDGANPVVVLDNETIRNSGASDVRQLLVRRGMFR